VAFLQALLHRAPKALAEGRSVAARGIDDAVETLILRPRREEFVAPVIEASVVGKNADPDRKTTKYSGETEGGRCLKIRSHADGTLGSQSAPHLPRTWYTGDLAQRFLRAHKGLDDKPLPDQPGRCDLVSGHHIGVPPLANAGANGHGRHEPRIAHAHGDRREQTICEPFVSGLQAQRVDTAFALLGGIEFRTKGRSQHGEFVEGLGFGTG